MEKEKFLFNGSPPALSYRTSSPSTWQSPGLEVHGDMNSSSEPLPSSFLNLNFENSMDQSVPFHSALSSIVSSPGSGSGSAAVPADNVAIRELIARLGSICNNSGDISPQSQTFEGTNSVNNSCYSTPLNSPPKLNLSMDQSRGNMPISASLLAATQSLTHFAADPAFVERAARFSCFGSRNYTGLGTQFGFQEPELGYRSVPLESGKLSRASSSQSLKGGALASVLDNKEITTLSGPLQSETELRSGSGSDRKLSRLSRSSTPASVDDATEPSNYARDESSASDQITGAEPGSRGLNEINARKRKAIPRSKAKDLSSCPSAKVTKAAEEDESKTKRSKPAEGSPNEKDEEKPKVEQNNSNSNAGDGNQNQTKENPKPPEPPKQDYIHVRARRGQATDSHSLAERVRREKISERMKFLQDLVPGCNKVTGKAVMLDEIINYVQSLQRQVEFLSMKLATVNPRLDFNMEGVLSKDLQSREPLPNTMYTLDSSASSYSYGHQAQQGLVQSTISTGSETRCSVNPLELRRTLSMQLPMGDGYADTASQLSTFWDDELQSVIQMGFGQNQETAFSLQSFHGTLPAAHMKIEL